MPGDPTTVSDATRGASPRLDPVLAAVVLVVSLAVPFLVDATSPPLEPGGVTLELTRGTGRVDVGADAAARLVDRDFASGLIDPDGPFPIPVQSLRFAFDVDRAGRYTIFGRFASDLSRPVKLSVNGHPLSYVAFYETTDGRVETHRIATGVRLSQGTNTVSLVGGELSARPLAIELRRERDGTLLRLLMFFIPFVVALAPLGALWTAVRSWTPGPRVRLAGTCLVAAAVVVVPLLVVWTRKGEELVALGHKHPELQRRVEAFEDYLRSERVLQDRRDTYLVAVLGDSTHYLLLSPQDEMIPQLRRHLPPEERDRITFFGVSGGGMAAWDYYLLLNRLLDVHPDLVVLPVNCGTFSEGWMRNEGYWFPILERYLRFSEYPGALRLSVAGRRFDLGGLLLQRLDGRLLGHRAVPFLRGMRVWVEEERKRLSEVLQGLGPLGLPAAPDPAASPGGEGPSWQAAGIGPDHELLSVYRRINRLAERHGIDLLYYNVYELSHASGGVGLVTGRQDVDAIFGALATDDGVHILRFDDEYPARYFIDRWIHLSPEGLSGVAARLADRVVAIKARRERQASATAGAP